jgi:N-carbamoylputrescine amidase
MQRAHAVANGCFVAAPNRIGLEKIDGADGRPVNAEGIEFWGQSFVSGPDGRILQRAPANRASTLLVDCDLARVEFSRTHWPFLRDRRIDAYGALSRRFVDEAVAPPPR